MSKTNLDDYTIERHNKSYAELKELIEHTPDKMVDAYLDVKTDTAKNLVARLMLECMTKQRQAMENLQHEWFVAKTEGLDVSSLIKIMLTYLKDGKSFEDFNTEVLINLNRKAFYSKEELKILKKVWQTEAKELSTSLNANV